MQPQSNLSILLKWLPTRGNVLFTFLIAIGLFLYVQRVEALVNQGAAQETTATSTTTLPYQGRLTDTNGNPVNTTKAMAFRLYNAVSGGTALWEEAWPSVQVSDGLFNVLLGSTTPLIPTLFAENNSLWLGITVGTDAEMTPRVQVGSVPFAMQAVTVAQENVAGNHQTVLGDNEITVTPDMSADLLSLYVNPTQPSTLRIFFRSTVWKDVAGGRTAIGIRIDGLANSNPDSASVVQVGTPMSAGLLDSLYLFNTYLIDVSAGTHTVTLVLMSWDSGTAHARAYGMTVETLKQP